MKIPLSKRLKKRLHLEIAMLQDEVVEIIYSLEQGNEFIFHGGTAIWRCYNGNRFSEDLDFYGKLTENFREKLESALKSRGLELKKYKQAPNVVFVKITDGTTEVRLEISALKAKEKLLKKYEKADGTAMDVYTLSPENLIDEKMNAYTNRKFIRDIYDIYFLVGQTEGTTGKITDFIKTIEKPVDEENLRAIVYAGAVPSFREMIEALRGRLR